MSEIEDSDSSESSTDSSESTETNEEEESENEKPVNPKITLKARKDTRSLGRWKVLCEKKKFKPEWRDIYPWVEEHPSDQKLALCTICNSSIKALKPILESHQKSKRHLKNAIGPDYVEEKREKSRSNKAPPSNPPPAPPPTTAPGVDPIDEQISFLTESPADAAHQAVTSIVDKLVEKYHENRLKNLKVQNETILQLNVERAKIIRSENQRKLERRLQQEAFLKEAQETQIKLIQMEHETMLNAMEEERDAKLRAVEQELLFAKQEYEKKVRLLDSQLSSMK